MLHRVLLGISVFLLMAASVGAIVVVARKPVHDLAVITLEHLPTIPDRSEPPAPSAKLVFVGDIMLARRVEDATRTYGINWPYEKIREEWADADAVIGNFEGTIRETYRYEGVDVMNFDTTPDAATAIAAAGFTHLSLANNHGDDFGSEVTIATRSILESASIVTIGDPYESQNFVSRSTIGGLEFSFVGFHAFGEYPNELVEAIQTEDAAGRFVIVLPHWGVEYRFEPYIAQEQAAQIFIDAGADLIIGAHPHVVEPISIIDDVPVAYSLGNFIFDQDWSAATQEGLLLHVTINEETVTIKPVPISIHDRQASVMSTSNVPGASERTQEILEAIGVPMGSLTLARPLAPMSTED